MGVRPAAAEISLRALKLKELVFVGCLLLVIAADYSSRGMVPVLLKLRSREREPLSAHTGLSKATPK